MNRRGAASIAAFGWAAVVGAAVLSMVASASRELAAAGRRWDMVRARAHVVADAVRWEPEEEGDVREAHFERGLRRGDIRITIRWEKHGGRWRALTWTESAS